MYSPVLAIHSILRWAVFVLGVLAVARAIGGARDKRPWDAGDKRAGLFFMIAVDLQLVIGLWLYFGLSPLTRAALANMKLAMRTTALRFWAVEHITLMLLAVVAVHVARIASKRATGDTAKHRRVAIGFALAMVLILAAIPWPFLGHGRPLLRF